MDLLLLLVIFVASILCFLIFRCLEAIRNGVKRVNYGLGNKPPEATGSWPIIGHLHLLAGSQVPHKLLGSMADKFGSIFTIKLGVHRVLVVSNSEMAKECLATNDRVFASRQKAMAIELMGYNYANFGLGPYGPYWHQIRRIVVLELASRHRLQMLEHIRVSEVKSSIIDIYRTWFQKAIRRIVDLFGAFVPSDAIPWLRWLDLGGYEKKMKKTAIEMDVVINGWLEDHKKKKNSTSPLQVDESSNRPVFMAAVLSRVKEEVKEELYGFSTDDIVKASCLV
ncbi:hypothetical protein L1987_08654 [Smallanthus sonchifolius]|uniref:Uncharacterized protein n=1 Tax=Smallanthus sonchifolius TaxID=185202 RepID=A0ACB9JP49_9ASTR|nr:hypothetical protein L1987_08654 [Smallanthus sonchifolius]